jgi:hypothetical protein
MVFCKLSPFYEPPFMGYNEQRDPFAQPPQTQGQPMIAVVNVGLLPNGDIQLGGTFQNGIDHLGMCVLALQKALQALVTATIKTPAIEQAPPGMQVERNDR